MAPDIDELDREAGRLPHISISASRENRVLPVLIGGFVLIIAFLGLDGFVGFHGITSVRQSLYALTRTQLLESALIDDVQRAQAELTSVEYELPAEFDEKHRSHLTTEMQRIEQSLRDLFARVPAEDPNAAYWHDVKSASKLLTADIDRRLNVPSRSRTELTDLYSDRDLLSIATAKLIRAGHQRVEATRQEVDETTRRQSIEDRLLLACCLLVACLFLRTATRIYYKMTEQSQELQRVSWQLLEKQESLARRLSRELHDELGQSLTALKTNFSRHASSPCVNAGWMEDCTQLLKDSIRSAHEISQLLRPTLLDDFGLDSAIGWLCDRFEERNRIAVKYESDFHGRLEGQAETHIFRIAQEALTNIARHANASSVRVVFTREGEYGRLKILDDGRGIISQPNSGRVSFGLTGMRARARSLLGELEIRSVPGRGTIVDVFFPVWNASHEELHPHLVS